MQLHLLRNDSPDDLLPGMTLLRGFCSELAIEHELRRITAVSPPRSMHVPGGGKMSAATTSAGRFGWTSDLAGYAYSMLDPETRNAWPAIPQTWFAAAVQAAQASGFAAFDPDACLINIYRDAARMGMHQDRNEADYTQPVVSFSFGASAAFFYTSSQSRVGATRSFMLAHGDALVFGGPARLLYHGVKPLRSRESSGERINLTFRRVAAP